MPLGGAGVPWYGDIAFTLATERGSLLDAVDGEGDNDVVIRSRLGGNTGGPKQNISSGSSRSRCSSCTQ